MHDGEDLVEVRHEEIHEAGVETIATEIDETETVTTANQSTVLPLKQNVNRLLETQGR